MKKQKKLSKRFLISTNFLILIFFSALLAVFSVIRNNHSFHITEKIVNKDKQYNKSNNNNFIIQTPEANYEWANKLEEDINNLNNYNEKEKLTGNITYFYKKDKPILSNSVTFTVQTDYYDDIGYSGFSSGENKYYWKRYWDSLTDRDLESKVTNAIGSNKHLVSFDKSKISISGIISSPVSSRSRTVNQYTGGYNGYQTNPKQITIDQQTRAIVKKITIPYKYYFVDNSNPTSWEYLKKEAQTIWSKKIFMSSNDLNNNLWTKQNLKSLISFYTNAKKDNEKPNEYLINEAYLDKTKQKIIVSGNIKTIGTIASPQDNWYIFKNIEIPIHIIDLDFLIEGSILSDSYWKHLENGETQYHSQKPKTSLKLSEGFLKALYIFKTKETLIKKLNKDSWGFIGVDKDLAISKINSYQLNIENYENVRQAYIRSHDQNAINQLSYDHLLDKYTFLQKTDSLNEYLYILKNLTISIKYGIKNYDTKFITLIKFLKGLNLEIQDQELRNVDGNRTNWSMHVKDFQVSLNSNISNSLSNILKIDLPNLPFKNYDLNITYSSENKRELIHKYLYQKEGIDISKNITFVMEDGSVLNQDFQVVKASSESKLKINDYAYISIRYWATFSNGKQEYLTVISKNGKWFSPKYNLFLLAIDKNFNVKKLEYLFNQNLQMIINPYSKTITNSHIDVNEAKKQGITATPISWKYNGTYIGSRLPNLPSGIKGSPSSYLVSGVTSDLNSNIANVSVSPYEYKADQTFSKQEYDSLPNNLKSKFHTSSWNISGRTTNALGTHPSKLNGVTIEPEGDNNTNTTYPRLTTDESVSVKGVSFRRQAVASFNDTSNRELSSNNDGSHSNRVVDSSGKMDLHWKTNGMGILNSYFTWYTIKDWSDAESDDIVSNLDIKEFGNIGFDFDTFGDPRGTWPLNNYKSHPYLYFGYFSKKYWFRYNNNTSWQEIPVKSNYEQYLVSTQYNNDFYIKFFMNSDHKINLKIKVHSNNTDHSTYVMILNSFKVYSYIYYSYKGIYKGQNAPSLPSGVTATPFEYQSTQTFTKQEYDSIPNNLKSKFQVSKNKWQGIYRSSSPPQAPNGVTSQIHSYYISGVYESKTRPSSINGVSITPNSYELTSTGNGKPINMVQFLGKPKYGIKRVGDESENTNIILEDWNDGKWSHTHNQDGLADFDGIFGADMNGIFDYRGRLKEGKHHIKIELQNTSFKGLKNNFYINIDKNPVNVKIKGISSSTSKINIQDDKNKDAILYYSSGPINFTAEDIDIKSVAGQFIDYQGRWYDLPISIKSKKIDGKWKLTVDSTIDYAGFAKIKIVDQANNYKTLYFWLKKDGNETPDLNFKENILLDKLERSFLEESLKILKSSSKVVISSPLVSSINVSQQSLDKNNIWQDSKKQDFSITTYQPQNSKNYDFGKPINSTRSVLKFAGDELKPFLKQQTNIKWPVTNKVIDFKKPGLYRIILNTRFIDTKTIIKYIYFKDNNLNPIDVTKYFNEASNFNQLPNKNDGPKTNIDQNIQATENLIINIPKFLIKDYSVKFSLMWYSDFTELNNHQLIFNKEGKYKIYLKDIFGNEHHWNILLLKKSITSITRKKENMFLIATNEKEIDKTAFWKGKVIWNYFRYEDADHAKWEHDDFIRKAMDNGLTRKQAEDLYKKMKSNGNWDGTLPKDKDGNPFDFGKFYREAFKSSFNPQESKTLSKTTKIGIIVGSSVAGVLMATLTAFLIIKRFKGRKIK